MLKREITYTDYSVPPKTVTEVFYFNITALDIAGLEVEYKEGLEKFLNGLIKEEDRKGMFNLFKELILLGYGEREEDGKHFIKTPELRERFISSAAYQQLCYELLSSETALNEFVIGALPTSITESEEAKKILAATVPTPPTLVVPPPKPDQPVPYIAETPPPTNT